MVLVKKVEIFHLFLFGKICQENVFDDILERKNASLERKKNFYKLQKQGVRQI